MAALVEHSFTGGFLLDETRLRKLKDVIESRETRTSGSKIKYRVSRGDSYSYETESVDDVVNEDNEDWRRITRLDLKVSDPDNKDVEKGGLRFQLSFSDDDGCELRIMAEDRDRVFLLFSDLRDYIQNEVTVTRTIDRDTSRFLELFFSIAILLLVVLAVLYTADHVAPAKLSDVLKNPDIGAKLNFLIQQRPGSPSPRIMVFIGVGVALSLAALFGAGRMIVRLIFPGNEFLFGKRKERFEKRRRLTSNLLWGVAVALTVSVLAGLIVWRFTVPH